MKTNMIFKSGLFFLIFCTQFFVLLGQGQDKKKVLKLLNSSARETNLSISPNGKYLYFMSDRGGQTWSKIRKTDPVTGIRHYDGDIWYSVNIDGEWQAPVCLDNSINTYEGEDEPNITADGQRVYFQSWRDNWESTGGPYYMATLNGAIWENPVGLGGEITRYFQDLSKRTRKELIKRVKAANLYEYYLKLQHDDREEWQDSLRVKGVNTPDFWIGTDGMAISPDENIFIVSIYVPEKDNYDFMISRKNEEGIWSYPKPLSINSDRDEKSVFIGADNQTIFFASNRTGPDAIGGLDIYRATLLEGPNCTAPINLGPKFNTSKDDNSLILGAEGKSGFMVSNEEIFEVNLELDPLKAVVINGVVVDQDISPVAATIELYMEKGGKILGKSNSNKNSGEYGFSIKREEGFYKQVVHTKDGQTIDTIFEIKPNTPKVLNFQIKVNLPKNNKDDAVTALRKNALHTGEIIRLNRLQFDADRFVIKPDYYPTLDTIAQILSSKKKLRLEIGGHTNNLLPQDVSQQLSDKRALAVYDYLIKKGVPSRNLEHKGYGKTMPVAPNDNLYGRRLNQRVEFKVLSTE
jgi:outer membrane protein OmpA-like peptidoglycan-associated protein